MRAATLAVVLALTAAHSSAQPDALHLAMDMLRDWADAVATHHAGQRDAALSTLSAWTYNDLELMQPFLEAFAGTPERNEDAAAALRRPRVSGRDRAAVRQEAQVRLGVHADAFRRRAAIFHTDAAMLLDAPKVVAPLDHRRPIPYWAGRRTTRRVDVVSNDAEYRNTEYSNPHWEVAMDMLDAVSAPNDPLVAQWFEVIGIYLVEWRRYSDGLAHFERARDLIEDEPGVMFAEGRLHEALAAPLMQNFVRVTAIAQGVPVIGIDDQRTELRRAEALLQKTLTRDPSREEARLRLGHVIIQQQRWEEGLRQIQPLLEGSGHASITYYAHLFAGDAHLALGRTDDARRSFERALELFPDAQAARLGLAAAMRIAGTRDDAIAALLPAIAQDPRPREDDPWWIYYDRNEDAIAAALEQLRAPYRGPQ
jgi:tetratricopeptide (TPR) repeat protein